MKKFYKAVVCMILLVPVAIQAEGLGVYVPFSIYAQSDITTNPDNVFGGRERGIIADYDPAFGLGMMYDTNVGENRLLSYRAGLEYLNVGVDNVNGIESSRSNKRLDFINTFGFGIVRSEHLRLWIGPRINLAWNRGFGGIETTSSSMEIGAAFAVGTNIELSRELVLGMDIDYRLAFVTGDYDSDGTNSSGSFIGGIDGSTVRIYMIYMFGETFPKPMPQ